MTEVCRLAAWWLLSMPCLRRQERREMYRVLSHEEARGCEVDTHALLCAIEV